MAVFGLLSLQVLPPRQNVPSVMASTWSGVSRENHVAFIRAENLPSGSPDFNPLYCKLWVVLKDMVCRKRLSYLESLKKIPREGSGRDPHGDGECGASRVAGASRGLSRGILW